MKSRPAPRPRLDKILPIITLTALLLANSLHADEVIQIPVASILNTRPVTTLKAGKLTTWTIGIDGNGNADGYLTMAASLFMGDKNPHALPDSNTIAADARHPEVVLHYANGDTSSPQARYVRGIGDFTFPVPQAKYSKVFLFFTSSEGASTLQIQLTYKDSVETKTIEMPDYYADLPANDPVLFYLVKDLAKWNKSNKMTEATHHNIDGIELHPSPNRILTDIKVSKTAKGYLVFWAATGIATTPVTTKFRRVARSLPLKKSPLKQVLVDGRRVLAKP